MKRLMQRLWDDAEADYRSRLLVCMPRGESQRLLDVGCDDGAWTDEVRAAMGVRADQVIGLEVVEEGSDLARGRGFDVRSADLEAPWPVADGEVDVVHVNQVLEHVKRLDHFVSETRRVLKPGGVTVVCTENLASWHNVVALALGWQPFSAANISTRRPIGNPFALHAGDADLRESWQHVHVLTWYALRDLYRAHGFLVEKAWGAGYHPAWGRLARFLSERDPRHSHFIAVVARRDDLPRASEA
jgi:SAM-dependent methyltransferase